MWIKGSEITTHCIIYCLYTSIQSHYFCLTRIQHWKKVMIPRNILKHTCLDSQPRPIYCLWYNILGLCPYLNNCWVSKSFRARSRRWLTYSQIFDVTAPEYDVFKHFISGRHKPVCWTIFSSKRTHYNEKECCDEGRNMRIDSSLAWIAKITFSCVNQPVSGMS